MVSNLWRILVTSLIIANSLCAPAESTPKLWALLAAGSSGYYNYRHQADISHAYQVLKNHGVPEERIIVMMYDDIALNKQNPTPGVLINRPNGTNVYKGVKKDYIGKDVTPKNFINVLMGNKKAMKNVGSGRVIKSGPNDHIFVNFADHGAPGLLAFPRGGVLYARKLNKAIRKMHRKKKYSKMVFYVEACEAGSMFMDILKKDINVYATTAANYNEGSYACFFDNYRGTYLGDVYSVNWMHDSDVKNLNVETLLGQYKLVKRETQTSHVEEYGDLSIGSLPVASFQGHANKTAGVMPPDLEIVDAVDARDVPIAILKRKIIDARDKKTRVLARRKLRRLVRNRVIMNTKVLEILQKVANNLDEVDELWTRRSKLKNYSCYESVVDYFHQKCFSLNGNEYALAYMQKFVNVCEYGIDAKLVKSSMDTMCRNITISNVI